MMPRRKQTKPVHVQSDEEGEQENGNKSKDTKSSPSKTKGGGDGQKEEYIERTRRGGRNREVEDQKVEHQSAVCEEEVEAEEEEEVNVEEDDSDEKELLIAENENDPDSDDSDRDSDNSEDLDHPSHNGTMTRRQASQLKESGGDSGTKKKNRTCDYCGVVKATPAALIRHLRKHTGERPFVCTLCGKAYKAKRSLNLHENTVHKGLAKNPLPTQVPLENAAGVSLTLSDTVKPISGMPPISESTKSLLRETLESSRKARDGSTSSSNVSTATTTTTSVTTTTPTNDENNTTTAASASITTTTTTTSATDDTSSTTTSANPERLSAPNLVNLLTSDLSKKVEQILAASVATSLSSASTSSSPSATTSSPLVLSNYKMDQPTHLSNPPVVAKGDERVIELDLEDVAIDEEEEMEEGKEEEAEDLSIHPKSREEKEKEGDKALKTSFAQGIKCEFCPELFQNELAKAGHIRMTHGIIDNLNNQFNPPIPHEPKTGGHPGLMGGKTTSKSLSKHKSSSHYQQHHHHNQHHHNQHHNNQHHHYQPHKHKQSLLLAPTTITNSTQMNDLMSPSHTPKSGVRVPIPVQSVSSVDGKTWAGMMASAAATVSASDSGSAAFSALLSKHMRDSQAALSSSTSSSSLLSPSSSTSSPLFLSTHYGDGMVKMENGQPVVPVPSNVAMPTVPGTENGLTTVPTEENNALPYYITSRLLQDFNVDEVTLQDSEKAVLAEDGGHRRCRIAVMKETILATRLDGINNITGRLATVYKCHLCKRVFSSLVRYNNHMPSHADMEITTYDCRYCDASFRSHIQIVKHLQCHREKFAGFQSVSLEDPTATPQPKKKSDQMTGREEDSSLSLTNINLNSSAGMAGMNLMIPSTNEENGETLSTSVGHEPGERKNGGYSCPKCRKNFTREYLLQRHMRIHRNQNSFYCPDCESGFNGELDLMEHKKICRGLKLTEDQQKHRALLSQMHSNPLKHLVKLSDNNNNSGSPSVGDDMSGTMPSPSTAGVGKSGVIMPGSMGAGDNNGMHGGPFSMVDLKGIDLRRGEEVKVRMMGGLDDREKEEWMKQIWTEEYKKAWLSKTLEMQQIVSGVMSGTREGGLRELEQLKQNLIHIAQERMKWRIMEGEINAVGGSQVNGGARGEERSREIEERMERAKLRQEQEAEQRLEDEKKRKMERAQLKAKLAQQGMGDVTVVLPDAPSPDQNGSKVADAETRQSSTNSAKKIKTEDSPCNPLRPEKAESEIKTERDDVQVEETKVKSSVESAVNKRPTPTETGMTSGGPPAKSRRKALKPQKINHFEEDVTETLPASSSHVSNSNNINSSSNNSSSRQIKHTDNSKEAMKTEHTPCNDGNTKTADEAMLLMSKWKQLVALGGAQVFSAADMSSHPQMTSTPLNTLMARTLSSPYTNKLTAGFDNSGVPILYNNNNTTTNSRSDEVGCDNEAMDLSKSNQQTGPQLSSTPKPTSKIGPTEGSTPSSSPSPITSQDVDVTAGRAANTQKKSESLSRSISMENDSEFLCSNAAYEAARKNNSLVGGNNNKNTNNQVNLSLPVNPAQFTSALLGNAGMTPETAALIGLPKVLWSSGHNLSTGKPTKVTASSTAVIPSGKVNGNSGSICGNSNGSNSNSSCKSRTSSPSPVPSPNGVDATSSSDGRKVTSLSRTHSRLSVVNEPLDRNALCKPKMMDDGRSVYSCAICHKNFLSLSDINRHMDFHEDIRPYKCKYCDYYARTNSQLKVHKLRHEGVREFCCRVCNYKGVTQSDLNRHTKSQVHLLRSNHVCQQCGEGFVTPKALRDHTSNTCNGSGQDSSFEQSYDKDSIGNQSLDGLDDEEMDEEDGSYDLKDEMEDREMLAGGMNMRLLA